MMNFGNRENVLTGLRWTSLALSIFLALVLVAGQVVGMAGLDEALHKLSAGSLISLFLAALVANTLRYLRWPFFARAQGIHVPGRKLALYYVAGMALLPTPGKLGTALRLWLLNRHHKVPYTQSAPLLLLDFLTDMLAVVLLVTLALPFIGHAAGARLGIALLLVVIGGVVCVLYYPAATKRLLALAQRLCGDHAQKFFAQAAQVADDLRTLVGPRSLTIATGLSLAGWLTLSLAIAGVLSALGYGFAWPLAVFALGGGMTFGALSLLPGGLGSTEAAMFGILVGGGLSLADATLFTALVRVVTLWLPVAAGALALPLALKKK